MTDDKAGASPDWKQSRKRKHLILSASQIEEAELCARKWWLRRVARLDSGDQDSSKFLFGDRLHWVIERYMRADDRGYDEQGEAVNLYPDGWHIVYDKYSGKLVGELTPDEQVIIKKLIEAAIENGTLQRIPGRRVEESFRHHLVTGKDGTEVEIMGFIDLGTDDAVIDHKSVKSMRWAKTPQGLRENTQVLLYCAEKLMQAMADGKELPPQILARHNIFCKDPDDLRVKHVETMIPTDEILAKYQEIKELGTQLAYLRSEKNDWYEIPEPKNTNKACNAYGGCAFRSICAGRESIEGFRNRASFVATLNSGIPTTPLTIGEKPMSGSPLSAMLAKRKALDSSASKGAPAPTQAPPKEAAKPEPKIEPRPQPIAKPEAAEPEMTLTSDGTPPWHEKGCRACSSNPTPGFNSKGQPCRICDLGAKKAGRPQSSDFDVRITPDGHISWTAKGGTAPAGVGKAPSTDSPVKQQSKVASETAEEPETPSDEPETPETPSDEPEAAEAAETDEGPEAIDPREDAVGAMIQDRSRPGRPPRAFKLLVNCVPARKYPGAKKGSGEYVWNLDEILRDLGKQMAIAAGKASFYDLDVWDRRNKLCAAVPRLVEMFDKDIVVAEGVSSVNGDIKSLVDALRPYAESEFIPSIN